MTLLISIEQMTSDALQCSERIIEVGGPFMNVRTLVTRSVALLFVSSLGVACSIRDNRDRITPTPEKPPTAEKTAQVSFYGRGDSFAGKPTASGEPFDPQKLTAAHRTLPFGTKVRLESKETRRSVVVTINDRGPFVKGREFDISHRAAQELGIDKSGVATVAVTDISAK